MRIGVPKEIKVLEFRVSMTPSVVAELTSRGHEVFVETKAGAGIGLDDETYRAAGAKVMATADEVFGAAEMIVKVKEPQPAEVARLRPDHILFTYLHLAADKGLTKALQDSGANCIAYETVTDRHGRLPLLAPMSQVAGRMAVDVGAVSMLKPAGGRGLLLGGVPGVPAANVVILGGGVAGKHAAQMAVGHRANVTLFDISTPRLEELDDMFAGQVKTAFSTPDAILAAVREADLVIGAVLVPGAAAPKLIKRAHLKMMKPASVLVDVAIDQGGCFETSRPTTHADPTYVVDGIIHYCVANMPGAAPYTSTFALGAATAPYILALANMGVDKAFANDPGFAKGSNIRGGRITHPSVLEAVA
jgi:alanine dehydrogenase